ncbi:sulfur oxidation c-type cytochrome SoxX [Rhodoblastus acidophilus]|uniref:Sulfur oxidation c-type cytochrome SoxX n=1 Tax=Rhodoblastus acidophilus TaxID=1074 RepID=A0A6N8DIX0_RHOAC|nr:sulfur oxidation c-type cytochrome SoxX [Rhodoblastus acidophilus]MCW2272838.1 sulfur-oxidizing protein SoxX [Rhodoblastus acidophilus]MTV29746.1 sulfur oxidation c-type cytochrome SoxX [Rhodoblastus acidophilus]
MKTFFILPLLLAATPALAESGPKTDWGQGADDAAFAAMIKSSFHDKGIATLARLDQDSTQAFCSDPARATGASKEAVEAREKIEAENLATIKWPADNTWLGDWKKGEAVAQSGRGLTSSDKADGVRGGNCYNCHQISKQEIAYGTIGPSLWNYGKIKGDAPETLRYTWGKIYNSKAYNACSNMPRGGHMGILSEDQIRDLMALLLHPQSPVNQ